MGYPRSHLVDPDGGIYHVCSRWVRRAFLCGRDGATGFDFDHRRQWLEDRILALAQLFAVKLYGYAVMSNHYHVVLEVEPKAVSKWFDEEIADRWLQLFPQKTSHENAVELTQSHKLMLLKDEYKLQIVREHLGSLSWFMRCPNEPLARIANKNIHDQARRREADQDIHQHKARQIRTSMSKQVRTSMNHLFSDKIYHRSRMLL
jgi:putative transposase